MAGRQRRRLEEGTLCSGELRPCTILYVRPCNTHSCFKGRQQPRVCSSITARNSGYLPGHAARACCPPLVPIAAVPCSLLSPPWPTARSVCSRGVCKLLDHALRQRTAHMAAAAAGERGHVYLLCQACRRGTTVPPSSTNAHINRNGVQSELR